MEKTRGFPAGVAGLRFEGLGMGGWYCGGEGEGGGQGTMAAGADLHRTRSVVAAPAMADQHRLVRDTGWEDPRRAWLASIWMGRAAGLKQAAQSALTEEAGIQ